MSRVAIQFLVFLAFVLSGGIAAFLLGTAGVHPIAVFVAWLVSFVWGVACIIQGPLVADLLTKRWLQMMTAVIVLGGGLSLIFH